jgi:hypothetical protein
LGAPQVKKIYIEGEGNADSKKNIYVLKTSPTTGKFVNTGLE